MDKDEQELLQKYYVVFLEPHPSDPKRRTCSLVPTLVFSHPRGGTMDWTIHLIWYTHPSSYTWTFDHLTIVRDSLHLLTAAPDVITEISAITEKTQPQDVEQVLHRLGFARK